MRGMKMQYGTVISGQFLSRPNRFIAYVETQTGVEKVHVKNTGRCRELLVPGVTVYLEKGDSPARKTAYDLIAVEKGTRLINMDSQAPNKVFAEWVTGGGFLPEINVVFIYIDGTLYQPIAADRLSDDEAFYIPLSVLETKEEYTFIGHTFPGDSYTLPDEQFEASMMPQQNSIFFDGEYYYYHDKQSSMLIRLIPAPSDWIPGEYLAN